MEPGNSKVGPIYNPTHEGVHSDERAPEVTPELRLFDDADALDRWRIDDLDPPYLRTNAARRLLDASYGLWEATYGIEHASEMFEGIIDVAIDQGLVVGD